MILVNPKLATGNQGSPERYCQIPSAETANNRPRPGDLGYPSEVLDTVFWWRCGFR